MCKNAIKAGKSAIHAFKKLPTTRNAEVSNKAISCYNHRRTGSRFSCGGRGDPDSAQKIPIFSKEKITNISVLVARNEILPKNGGIQPLAPSSPMFITLLIKHRKLERVRLGSKRLG